MKIFRKRWFVASIGLLLIGLLIWFAGPYLAFADYHPFAPAWVRITLIALIVLFYVGGLVWKKFKAMQASATLATAVSRPAVATPGSADTEQLRQRFDEAIAQLKKDKRRVNLYELPWYVIIGAPGAGKTTVLRNSGLHFPLEQKFGREAMRGVGGTRNCDWWFTNEAVLLDTAGRYTTQDSDQAADNAGWKSFLALLVKYRKRRPLNGVILALSASDLLTQHAAEREQHIAALARRLDELERELRVRLPVYVLVTKSDLVAGFSEYFEDLALKERTQVWGTTFPHAKAGDGAAEKFPAEFASLVRRLNERVLGRVEAERDPRRKQAIFGFPQQWSTLGESLQAYLRGLFSGDRPGGAPMLRGVYFTSGTQEGNPIDRILGAVGRNLPQEAVLAPAAGAGKAYFIERLLREVMFAESGLAGVNRAAERRGLLLQIGTLAAAALFALLGITVLAVSYARNKAYVTEVDTAVRGLDLSPSEPTRTLDQGLPRLDALNKLVVLASRREEGGPLSMRWGLYRGNALGSQARDAYLRELNGFLLPKMAAAIQSRLVAYTAEPDKLYEYLKAYIMLGQPEHMDPAQLESLLDIEWETAYPDRPEVQQALSGHVKELLQARGGLRPMAIDEELVRRARIAIRQASVPKLIYSALRLQYSGAPGGVRVGSELGLGATQTLVRTSGRPLDEEISALYTPAVFDEVKLLGSRELVLRFAGESWVLGEDAISVASSEQIGNEVMGLYEDSYIAAWDAVLKDFKVAPFRTVDELRNGLAIIAGPSSPLRALLQLVDKNTLLIKPAKAEAPSAADKAQQAVKNRLDKLLSAGSKATGTPATAPRGTKVTQHFAELHRYVDASAGPAPIDRHLALIGQVQQRLQSVGTGLGEVNPLEAVVQSGSGDAVKALKQEAATLPPVLADLVNQVSQQSTTVAMGQARNELVNLYQTEVVSKCSAIATGRFPFQPAATSDVPLADFGRLFGTSGIFDSFYQQHLQALVDPARSPWRWRGDGAGSLGLSASILRQFELAQRIREVYFRPGGQLPEVRFTVTADALDAAATRVTLEIDGQSVDYRHGPVRAVPMAWPGPAPGTAAITFEDRSGTRPNIVTNGPWAMFRLLGKGSVQPQSEVRYFISWSAGGHDAKMLVEASSISNPFSGDLLRQFSCGA